MGKKIFKAYIDDKLYFTSNRYHIYSLKYPTNYYKNSTDFLI